MSHQEVRSLSNNFQDVRLVSLASWSKAAEITPRDLGGPYVVIQEGYAPHDLAVTVHEYILSRSGKWLALGHFYHLPVDDRRAEFVFGTAAEVMKVLGDLPGKVSVFGSGEVVEAPPEAGAGDELTSVIQAKQAGKQAV